nr:hypothetical protein [Methanosarcina barkeri]
MKIPKKFRSYCPYCKTHQEMTVERVRKGQASSMTRIARQKNRQQGIGNSGKFSKVPGGDKPQNASGLDTAAQYVRKPTRNHVSGQRSLSSRSKIRW